MARIQMDDAQTGLNAGEFDLSFDPRQGGTIRLAAHEVDASRTYRFSTCLEHDTLFEWRKVRGKVDGSTVVFELRGIQPC